MGLLYLPCWTMSSPRRFILTSYSSASESLSILAITLSPIQKARCPFSPVRRARRMQRDASSRIDLFTAHALTTPSTARWGNTRLITSRGSSDALLNRLFRIVPLRTCSGCQNFARVSRRPSAAQQSYGFFSFGSGRRSPSPGWAARAHVLMRMGGDEGLAEGNGGFPTRGGGSRGSSYLADCQAMVIGRVFQFQICGRGTLRAATLPGGALKPKGGAAGPRNAARPFPGPHGALPRTVVRVLIACNKPSVYQR